MHLIAVGSFIGFEDLFVLENCGRACTDTPADCVSYASICQLFIIDRTFKGLNGPVRMKNAVTKEPLPQALSDLRIFCGGQCNCFVLVKTNWKQRLLNEKCFSMTDERAGSKFDPPIKHGLRPVWSGQRPYFEER